RMQSPFYEDGSWACPIILRPLVIKGGTKHAVNVIVVDCDSKVLPKQGLLTISVIRGGSYVSHKKYQLVKTFTLACAHHIPDAGKCARIHGHNYRVTFCVEGTQLDEMDMLIDFRKVKKCLKERYDHQLLNKFPEFDPERGGVHPTTERVAEVFY